MASLQLSAGFIWLRTLTELGVSLARLADDLFLFEYLDPRYLSASNLVVGGMLPEIDQQNDMTL